MKKYKQKVRETQKLFTFYVENGNFESQKYPHLSDLVITYFEKEVPPLYG